MKSFVGGLIALILSVSVGAEPLLEGRVRLSSGQPAVGVQVRLFDLTDLRRFVGTTTDESRAFRAIFASVFYGQGHGSADRLFARAELSQSVQSFDHYSLPNTGIHAMYGLEVFNRAGAAPGDVGGCGTVGGDAHGAVEWDGCGGACCGSGSVYLPAERWWSDGESADGVGGWSGGGFGCGGSESGDWCGRRSRNRWKRMGRSMG